MPLILCCYWILERVVQRGRAWTCATSYLKMHSHDSCFPLKNEPLSSFGMDNKIAKLCFLNSFKLIWYLHCQFFFFLLQVQKFNMADFWPIHCKTTASRTKRLTEEDEFITQNILKAISQHTDVSNCNVIQIGAHNWWVNVYNHCVRHAGPCHVRQWVYWFFFSSVITAWMVIMGEWFIQILSHSIFPLKYFGIP